MSRNLRAPRSLLDEDRHVIEFTPGKLIVWICGLLIFGLTCFLMGVFVNKIDTAQKSVKAPPSDAAIPNPPTPPAAKVEDILITEGQQVTPRADATKQNAAPPIRKVELPPTAATSSSNARNAEPPANLDPPPKPPDRPAVRPSTIAKKGNASESIASGATKEDTASQTVSDSDSKAVIDPQPSESSTDPDVSSPSNQTERIEELAPLDVSDDAGEAETSAAADTKKGKYAIQVVSFSPTEKATAQNYQRRLKENTGIDSILSTSKDGNYLQVLVGSYPDRETAEKERQELKKRAGFGDCFVRPVN